jgi:hypothetical protein
MSEGEEAHMRATHVIAAMLGIVAAASIAMLVSAGFASSDQPPLPVLEENKDATGNIKVHEQGTATVRSADNPARQPFRRVLQIGLDGGALGGKADFIVPAGKRLVIEYVSAAGNTPVGQGVDVDILDGPSPSDVDATPDAALRPTSYPNAGGGVDLFSSSDPVRIYVDPGNHVFVLLARTGGSGESGPVFSQISISGHLVDPE